MSSNNENKSIVLYQKTESIISDIRNDKSPRVGTIDIATGQQLFEQLTYTAAMLRGTSITEEQLKFSATAAYDEIRRDFPRLTLREVLHAIHEGCFGKYGEMYGVNAVSIYKAVEAYVYSEERAKLKEIAGQRIEKQKEKNAEFLRNNPDYIKSTL